jgi:hypothetical protein
VLESGGRHLVRATKIHVRITHPELTRFPLIVDDGEGFGVRRVRGVGERTQDSSGEGNGWVAPRRRARVLIEFVKEGVERWLPVRLRYTG